MAAKTAKSLRVPDSGKARQLHVRVGSCSMQGVRDNNADRHYMYAGDRFLLASGGITDNITGGKIKRIINQFENPQEAAEEPVYATRGEGGDDDTTAVVFYVSNGGRRQLDRHELKAGGNVRPPLFGAQHERNH